MGPSPQETAELITFTEEIRNGKLHFLWCVESHATCHKVVCFEMTFCYSFSQLFIKKKLLNGIVLFPALPLLKDYSKWSVF